MSRNKGQAGEREFARLTMEAIAKLPHVKDVTLKRNLMQTAEGGFDLVGIHGLALEIKRQERLNLSAWWKQTILQANRIDYNLGLASVGCRPLAPVKMPVLAYRQNKCKWVVLLPVNERFGVLKKIGLFGPYLRELTFDEYISWLSDYLDPTT